MQIQFIGATGTVTGSKYLLTLDKKHYFVDCGLFQGLKVLRLRNWNPLPIKPKAIDAVILTHAHIDHTGYLPLLVKNGFRGTVYATAGTRALCRILLPDSGHLQEEDADFMNRHHLSKHRPALPLYTEADAVESLRYFETVSWRKKIDLSKHLSFQFLQAGHILGAGVVQFTAAGRQITFSGDLGRPNGLIMKSPTAVAETDYLGSSRPMATDATRIFCDFPGDHALSEEECQAMCDVAKFVTTVEESKRLNTSKEPAIIISASGMLTGGRVLHHLKFLLPNPKNLVLFVGFQAAGTRGEAMLDGADQVKIHGEMFPVRAEVRLIDTLSAHADADEILGWLKNFARPPKMTFITHGEPLASEALRKRIDEELHWPCEVPDYLEIFELK